jgi:diacylglycerol kinase (ATP)
LKRATLIYNPIAGASPAWREREMRTVRKVLAETRIDAQLVRTSGPGTATGQAREACKSGVDVVIVCGGDGTVNEVVNGMVPGDVPLGILPGGTGNIIARDLELPGRPVWAARRFHAWKPRRVALGYATGRALSSSAEPVRRYFLGVAGVGYDAYVISHLKRDFVWPFGVAAYLLEGIKQLVRYSFPPVICQANGRKIEAAFAIVQRTSLYAGWLRTAPGQALTKPVLGLTLYKSRNRGRYFVYGAAAIVQRLVRDMERMEVCEVSFAPTEDADKVFFELDGELAGALPARFEVVQDALPLLMP